jgi:N-acetylglucosamine repressor
MPKINSVQTHLLRVLSLVYRHESISRTRLATSTGYSSFLISKLTERLLKGDFIREMGAGESSGGRPPTLLSINPGIGHLVGVHMGTINLRLAVTDMCGRVLAHKIEKSLVDKGPDEALNHLLETIFDLLKAARISRHKLSGVGMGISGLLDRERGITLSWPKVPSWANVPVRSFLEDNLGTFVEVDDTPRTMALAEKRYGKARNSEEFVYLTFGAGIGAALFLHGKLYAGQGGFAGEFGHTTIDEHGPLCSCGNRGCVEALVSASIIIRQAEEGLAMDLSPQLRLITQQNGGRVTLEGISSAAQANDRFCLGLLLETGVRVGTGIVSLVNLLNPELIVLGGGLPKAAGKWLLPSINRVVQERAMQGPSSQVSIVLSDLTEVDWARGAALLVSENALRSALLKAVGS